MSGLKLLALDGEDLAVVSAHVQDSVARIGDLSFAAGKGNLLARRQPFRLGRGCGCQGRLSAAAGRC